MKRIAAFILLAAGMILMFYPWISNALYEHAVDSKVAVYEENIRSCSNSETDQLLAEACEYNESLQNSHIRLTDPFTDYEDSEAGMQYSRLLSQDDTGLMCFVEIPKIDVYLPVYHGTSAEILEKGIGHIERTSLPVGGQNTHAVLSGHTGIESSKMFTDLILLETGDIFYIHVLNETLAYQVTEINVIEPEDTSRLVIQKGKDLVSLLTCTPYGINSHRLVVTGERTDCSAAEKAAEEAAEEASAKTGKAEKGMGNSQWMQGYRKDLLTGGAIALAGILILAFRHLVRICIRRLRHA